MLISEAQCEVRTVYLGGFVGQLVSALIWLAGAAALHKPGWFYPASMIIVGAHYLPFVFLYGMKTFAVLAAALISAGFAIGLIAPDQIVMGGWVGGAVLFGFAFILLAAFTRGTSTARGGSS